MRAAQVFVAIAVIATAAGCSGTASETAPTSESPTTSRPPVADTTAYGGLDPCSLAQPAEVEALTGLPDLRPISGGSAEDPLFIGCDWGSGPGSFGIAFSPDTGERPGDEELSALLTSQIGHASRVQDLSGTCMTATKYADDREVALLIRPSEARLRADSSEGTICSRSLPAIATILKRVPWR